MLFIKTIIIASSLASITSEELALVPDRSIDTRLFPREVALSLCKQDHFSFCVDHGIMSVGDSLSVSNSKKDPDRAKKLLDYGLDMFTHACDGGDGEGCYNLGISYESVPALSSDTSLKTSFSFYRRSCELGFADGCRVSGELLSSAKDPLYFGETKNSPKDFFERGCSDGSAQSCYFMGEEVFVQDKPLLAEYYFRDSCSLGSKEGCLKYALILVSSNTPDNFKRAISPLTSSCQEGSGVGCYLLGMSYSEGLGCTKDVEQSKELLEKACELGESNACEEMSSLSINSQ